MKLSPSDILLVQDMIQEREEKYKGCLDHHTKTLQRQLTHELNKIRNNDIR
tara:strand:+ start:3182 stop:3334 length:153 start_codon:yes stop_codon:yes gene_type:complete